jgi:TonB family protein
MRVRLAVSVLILSCLAFGADKQQQAQEIWQKAKEIMWLGGEKTPAYHQVLQFTINAPGQPTLQGEYRRDYLDKDHFRNRITAGEFDDIFLRNGEKAWRKSIDGWRPANLNRISSAALPGATFPTEPKVKRVIPIEIEGVQATCIEYESGRDAYCFNANGRLTRTETPDEIVSYSDFRPFGNKNVPFQITIATAEGSKIVAKMELSSGEDIQPALFEPPPTAGLNSIPAPCREMKPPQVISTKDPDHINNGIKGTVVLWTIIGTDGRPSNIRVQRSLSPENDAAAIAAVKHWRFSPGECKGEERPTQVNVEVNFFY